MVQLQWELGEHMFFFGTLDDFKVFDLNQPLLTIINHY